MGRLWSFYLLYIMLTLNSNPLFCVKHVAESELWTDSQSIIVSFSDFGILVDYSYVVLSVYFWCNILDFLLF